MEYVNQLNISIGKTIVDSLLAGQDMFFDFKKNSAWVENLTLVMQLGLSMAGSVVLCFFIGRLIDRWLGTGSVFLVIFTILGVIGGAYLAYRNIMAVMTSENHNKDSDPNDGHQ